jgi:hypothetical protein
VALFRCWFDAVRIGKPATWTKRIEAAKNRFAAAKNESGIHTLRREAESCFDEVLVVTIHSRSLLRKSEQSPFPAFHEIRAICSAPFLVQSGIDEAVAQTALQTPFNK